MVFRLVPHSEVKGGTQLCQVNVSKCLTVMHCMLCFYQPQQQQPQQLQQQPQLQQPGMYPALTDLSVGNQQGYPSVAVPSTDQAVYPNASIAPQHSAPPVVYNSQQPQQLVSCIKLLLICER